MGGLPTNTINTHMLAKYRISCWIYHPRSVLDNTRPFSELSQVPGGVMHAIDTIGPQDANASQVFRCTVTVTTSTGLGRLTLAPS